MLTLLALVNAVSLFSHSESNVRLYGTPIDMVPSCHIFGTKNAASLSSHSQRLYGAPIDMVPSCHIGNCTVAQVLPRPHLGHDALLQWSKSSAIIATHLHILPKCSWFFTAAGGMQLEQERWLHVVLEVGACKGAVVGSPLLQVVCSWYRKDGYMLYWRLGHAKVQSWDYIICEALVQQHISNWGVNEV